MYVSVLAQAALAALAVYATQESWRLQERRGDRLRKKKPAAYLRACVSYVLK